MKFGFFMPARVDAWQAVQRAEAAGFDSAWLYDSQMLYADTFACLALCAQQTTRIRLGSGVTNPVTRIAPVMASAMGTINQLAPGRTFLGIGTGYSTMRAAGFPAARVEELREYIRVVRALVRGEAVEYTLGRQTRVVQMIHREASTDATFMNLRDAIPIYVAASGPRSRAVAGEFGDAVVLTGRPTAADIAKARDEMRVGAERAGRRVEDIPIILYTSVYVLEPGESTGSERMRKILGAGLQSTIGCYAAGYRPGPGPAYGTRITDEEIPSSLLPLVQKYREIKADVDGPAGLEGRAWYITAFEGHVWRLHPALEELVTAKVLESRPAIVGTADEVSRQIKDYEDWGVSEFCVILNDSLENVTVMLERFGNGVIQRY